MALWDQVKQALALQPVLSERPLQKREIDPLAGLPSLQEQIGAIRATGTSFWRSAGLREMLGIPSIYRAVTLISNTVGALSLEAYRQGSKLSPDDTPAIVKRPNPLATPRDFMRETTWSLATRGEFIWWIAKTDNDGLPVAVIPLNPVEVTIAEDPKNPLRPKVTWRDKEMTYWLPGFGGDIVHGVLAKEPGALRGMGPLQACGAALSVTVEAQEWAANFFAAGGSPSVEIKSALPLTSEEATALKYAWMNTPPNMPRVTDPGIEEVKEHQVTPAAAQLIEARDYQNGEAAVMFGIPGSLLDHMQPGASLTYQNVGQEFDKFVRSCLWPNYLEPIEQAMSDLLTRSTITRFNIDALLRADVKSRYDVYASGITSGVLTVDEARTIEGLGAGDVENRPIPFAPPIAVPSPALIARDAAWRCESCDRLLAEGMATGVRIKCPRCGSMNELAA